ncbi:MAG TPA: hypothetical protein VIO16_11320 [Dehalococcoidia bacterium]
MKALNARGALILIVLTAIALILLAVALHVTGNVPSGASGGGAGGFR